MSLMRMISPRINTDTVFIFGAGDVHTKDFDGIVQFDLDEENILGKSVINTSYSKNVLIADFTTIEDSAFLNAFKNRELNNMVFTTTKIGKYGMESAFKNTDVSDVTLSVLETVGDWGLAHAFSGSTLGKHRYTLIKDKLPTNPQEGDIWKTFDGYKIFTNGDWAIIQTPNQSAIRGELKTTESYGYDFYFYNLKNIELYSLYHMFEDSYVNNVHMTANMATKYNDLIIKNFGSWERYIGCRGSVLFDADTMWTTKNRSGDPIKDFSRLWMWNGAITVCDVLSDDDGEYIEYPVGEKHYLNEDNTVTVDDVDYLIINNQVRVYNFPQNVLKTITEDKETFVDETIDDKTTGKSTMWSASTRNKQAIFEG